MRIVLAGPCGVGKTTVAPLLSECLGVRPVDFDRERREAQSLDLSITRLNLPRGLPPILAKHPQGCVLDVGGDTIFRPTVDNSDRLAQIVQVKKTHGLRIVLLTASEPELRLRFSSCKGRVASEFDELWEEWQSVGERFWRPSADLVLDTTALAPDQIADYLANFLLNEASAAT